MSEISERLEEARVHVQGRWGSSFRAWWEALQGDGFELSYSGARNYHEDREPPASYIARVCEVHGVNPDYLLLGERPVLRQHRAGPKIRRALEGHREDVEEVLKQLEDVS